MNILLKMVSIEFKKSNFKFVNENLFGLFVESVKEFVHVLKNINNIKALSFNSILIEVNCLKSKKNFFLEFWHLFLYDRYD